MRVFWYSKAGVKHYLKNLGWLMRRASRVVEIHLSKSIGGKAHFEAVLENGIVLYSPFESYSVAHDFAQRRAFRNAKKVYYNVRD